MWVLVLLCDSAWIVGYLCVRENVCAQLSCEQWFTVWAVRGQSAAAFHAVCIVFSKITCSSCSTDCWGGLCCVTSVLIKQQKQSLACSFYSFHYSLENWSSLLHLPFSGSCHHISPNPSTIPAAALCSAHSPTPKLHWNTAPQHLYPITKLWLLIWFDISICFPVSVTTKIKPHVVHFSELNILTAVFCTTCYITTRPMILYNDL